LEDKLEKDKQTIAAFEEDHTASQKRRTEEAERLKEKLEGLHKSIEAREGRDAAAQKTLQEKLDEANAKNAAMEHMQDESKRRRVHEDKRLREKLERLHENIEAREIQDAADQNKLQTKLDGANMKIAAMEEGRSATPTVPAIPDKDITEVSNKLDVVIKGLVAVEDAGKEKSQDELRKALQKDEKQIAALQTEKHQAEVDQIKRQLEESNAKIADVRDADDKLKQTVQAEVSELEEKLEESNKKITEMEDHAVISRKEAATPAPASVASAPPSVASHSIPTTSPPSSSPTHAPTAPPTVSELEEKLEESNKEAKQEAAIARAEVIDAKRTALAKDAEAKQAVAELNAEEEAAAQVKKIQDGNAALLRDKEDGIEKLNDALKAENEALRRSIKTQSPSPVPPTAAPTSTPTTFSPTVQPTVYSIEENEFTMNNALRLKAYSEMLALQLPDMPRADFGDEGRLKQNVAQEVIAMVARSMAAPSPFTVRLDIVLDEEEFAEIVVTGVSALLQVPKDAVSVEPAGTTKNYQHSSDPMDQPESGSDWVVDISECSKEQVENIKLRVREGPSTRTGATKADSTWAVSNTAKVADVQLRHVKQQAPLQEYVEAMRHASIQLDLSSGLPAYFYENINKAMLKRDGLIYHDVKDTYVNGLLLGLTDRRQEADATTNADQRLLAVSTPKFMKGLESLLANHPVWEYKQVRSQVADFQYLEGGDGWASGGETQGEDSFAQVDKLGPTYAPDKLGPTYAPDKLGPTYAPEVREFTEGTHAGSVPLSANQAADEVIPEDTLMMDPDAIDSGIVPVRTVDDLERLMAVNPARACRLARKVIQNIGLKHFKKLTGISHMDCREY